MIGSQWMTVNRKTGSKVFRNGNELFEALEKQ